MKDSDRPWASPLLLVLCLTVPALLITWAVSRPLTYALPRHLATSRAATEVVRTEDDHQLQMRLETLEAREVVLRETIAQQQQTSTLGLGIVTILLTAVGLLLPVITYLTSILPSQKVVEEARKATDGLDQRFAELTALHRKQEADEAIAKLQSNEEFERDRALEHLLLRARGSLDDQQVRDIAAAARTTADEELRFRLITMVLGDYNSPYLFEVLLERLASPRANMYLERAIRNCEVPGSDALRLSVKKYGATKKDGLRAVLHGARREAPGFLRELINDSVWLATFSQLDRAIAANSFFDVAPELGPLLEASELAASVKGRVAIFFGDPALATVVPPENATGAKIFEDGRLVGTHIAFSDEFAQARDQAIAARGASKG